MQAGGTTDGSRVEMVVFGSGGHVGPLRLASTDFISAAQKSTLQVPAAIGDFAAIKLCKSAMLSLFVALSVSQTLNVLLLQTTPALTGGGSRKSRRSCRHRGGSCCSGAAISGSTATA